jgi:hypothetical protein
MTLVIADSRPELKEGWEQKEWRADPKSRPKEPPAESSIC